MSWFKRKPRNRRLERDKVLDVKLRSGQVRSARVRLAVMALGLLFSTIFGLYAVWQAGSWVLNRLVYENHAFSVQDVQVQTDGVIAPEQLRRWSGVRAGDNLFALDLPRVKRDLEMASMIRSVAVERVLPRTLRLRVRERDPLAQVYVPQALSNGGFQLTILHLDEEGYVMVLLVAAQRSLPPSPGEDILPVITGLPPTELAPGRRIESAPGRAALRLITAFERSPMAGLADLRQIDVSTPDTITVETGQGSSIIFSTGDPDKQLRRWFEIESLGQRINRAVAWIDLSVSNNVPTRWVEAANPPPVPKGRNPQHNRRKNV